MAKLLTFDGQVINSTAYKGMVAIPFSIFCSGGCWWMFVLDYKKGGKENL